MNNFLEDLVNDHEIYFILLLKKKELPTKWHITDKLLYWYLIHGSNLNL